MEEDTRRFRLPNFNLRCRIYRYDGTHPGVFAGDSPCQLRYGWFGAVASVQGSRSPERSTISSHQGPPTVVLFPIGTDVRDRFWDGSIDTEGDLLQLPEGEETYYEVLRVERCHAGFPNEYLAAVVSPIKIPPRVFPIPPLYVPPDGGDDEE